MYYFCCSDFVVSDLKAVWSGPTAVFQRQWNMNVLKTALVESCWSYGCKTDDSILYTWWRGGWGEEYIPTVNAIIHVRCVVCFCLLFFHFFLISRQCFCLLFCLFLFDFVTLFLLLSACNLFLVHLMYPSHLVFFFWAVAEEPFPDLWWILRESWEGPEAAAGAQ